MNRAIHSRGTERQIVSEMKRPRDIGMYRLRERKTDIKMTNRETERQIDSEMKIPRNIGI
jgi:hypothetical protein